MNDFVKADITRVLELAFNTSTTANGKPISLVADSIDIIVSNEIERCAKYATKKQMIEHLCRKNK